MDPIIVIEEVAILAVLMLVGYAGGKGGIIGEDESKAMTTILTNIALPALILSAFSIGYSEDTLRGVIIVFILSFGAHILGAGIGKIAFMKYPKSKNVVLRFGNIFSNSGFMGVAFVSALLGQEALIYASVFMIPFNILAWTYGESLLRKEKEKVTVKRIIKNPPIIAILVGLLIFIINIPLANVLYKPISMLSAITSPLAMLIIGEKISKLKFRQVIGDRDVYYASFVRLMVVPFVTFLILSPINIDPLIKNVVIILQGLPVATLTVVLSEKHNGNVELATKVTVVSHMLCIITIPIISLLL